MRGAVNADLPFFHNLKQGGLRLGRSTVYLVHQHEVGKHRSLMEVKVIGFHVEDRSTQHVTRHQVRSKLNAAEIRLNQTGNQTGKQRLCHPRHSLQQHMAVCQDSRQYQVHYLLLPHYDRSNPVLQRLYLLGKESQVHPFFCVLFHKYLLYI